MALVSTGPGAANAMGGLLEAYHASSRVLLLTGQSETRWEGKGRSTIHESDRQLDMLRTVTRRSEHVDHHAEIATAIVRVARDVLSGRPRPGAVEVPIDLQHGRGPVDVPTVQTALRPVPDGRDVTRAAELLAGSTRPLIWAGGGVVSSGASAALVELAERLGAPVLTSVEGRGAIPEDHPLALGPNGDTSALDPVIAAADTVLAVGTRFQLASNLQMALSIPGRLIHVDADPGVIDRLHPVDLGIVADADLALRAIDAELAGRQLAGADTGFVDAGRRALAEVRAEATDAMGDDHAAMMATIRNTLGRDAVVVKDSTVAGIVWANRLLEVYEPRTSMRPVSAAIGPGLPLAIGAAIGSGRPTVVIQGDGGLMLSLGELATVVQEQLPIVTCVFNDRGYGILRYIQDRMFDGRRAAVDLQTPDFAATAASMGMASASVSSPAEFATAFAGAVASGEPWLLDVDITSMTPMRVVPQSPNARGRRTR